MSLAVFINGAFAARKLGVVVDDRVTADREFGVKIIQDVQLGLIEVAVRPQDRELGDGRRGQRLVEVTFQKVNPLVQQSIPGKVFLNLFPATG